MVLTFNWLIFADLVDTGKSRMLFKLVIKGVHILLYLHFSFVDASNYNDCEKFTLCLQFGAGHFQSLSRTLFGVFA